ncbi:hypothetical protein [Paraburkholderia mimosarum]|uniref:hypothetical protein n=1 Tax=Paraburkholderia mimosarum TaxID=312026 RepID=UPI000486CD2C|nr:hypothetical protein [Paraburkholderia mimosarum]
MSTTKALPDDFSGVAEFKMVSTDFATGEETVSAIYIKHFFNGELHREDGPAVLLDGKPHQWWVNGHQFSEEEYGHFLEKKALKEKLESNLGEKGSSKRGKI